MRRTAATILAVLAVSGTAGAETLRLEGVFAARAREAGLLPTIGVARLRGPLGDELGEEIERRLALLAPETFPHPRLVPASLRPDGLVTGGTDVSVEEHPYTEKRRRCAEKDAERKCVRREEYEVRCLRRAVRFRAELRLTAGPGARVVYAAAEARDAQDSGCEDGLVLSADALLAPLVRSVAEGVRLDLAPHRRRYAVRVREERDGLSPADAARFRAAVRLTKRDAAGACRAFAAIGADAPDHGPTLFNRALCAEAEGRYADARDLYARARVFGRGFGGAITEGQERAASRAAAAEDARVLALRR